jgi:hypothetical protein
VTAGPLVVCVVPTRDRAASALTLLDALAGQTARATVDLRVLVWDDASSPGERERLRAGIAARAGAPSGLPVALHESDRWERMRVKRRLDDWALSLEPGRGDAFVAHLDDDVVPEPGWLTAALAGLRDPRFAGCGSVQGSRLGTMLAGQRRLRIEPAPVPGGSLRVWSTRLPDLVHAGDGPLVEVAFAGHRALVVRRSALADAPHDPVYRTGGDLDWSLALRAAGHRLAIAPAARIAHRAAGEANVAGYLRPELVLESWRRFHRTWGFVRDSGAAQAGMTRAQWLASFDPAVRPARELPAETLAAG